MNDNRCCGCMRSLELPGSVCPACGYDNTAGPAAQPAHALPCGTVLNGRYMIGRVLGMGGFSLTYIGYNLILDEPVCIKEYFPAGAMRSSRQSLTVYWGNTPPAQDRQRGTMSFVREAQKARKLQDLQHVVTVWDVFFENETAYIVMEYIEGETLERCLKRRRQTLSEKTCVELLAPVIEDLITVHRRGIIHLDIKPDNLMLQQDGTLVLLDLGAARYLDTGYAQSSCMVASRGFTPMEQYQRDGRIGPWTDVYAMCATIYYCISGRLVPNPLDRMSGEEILWQGVSPEMKSVLEKGLALRGDGRFQDMESLLNALKEAFSVTPPTPSPWPLQKLLLLIPAAILLTALVIFLTPRLRDHDPSFTSEPVSHFASAAPTEADILPLDPEPTEKAEESPQETESGETDSEAVTKSSGEAVDAKSLYEEGLRYENGTGLKKDLATANKYYLRAAAAGSLDAKKRLASAPNVQIAEALLSQDHAVPAAGTYGQHEHIWGYYPPFYLDAPLIHIQDISIVIYMRDKKGGWPYGAWGLYVRDPQGVWRYAARVDIEKTLDVGKAMLAHVSMENGSAVTALALCPLESGMDFTVLLDVYYIVSEETIGSYSSTLPRPKFIEDKSDQIVYSVHFEPPRPITDSTQLPQDIRDLIQASVCFPAGTLVHTESGLVPIEKIQKGDMVWSWNDSTGSAELKSVIETYCNPCVGLVHLTAAGEKLSCTAAHKFYVPEKGWVRAGSLTVGDTLVLLDGEQIVIEKLQFERLASSVPVYNFHVQDNHSYYVGQSGFRVHNASEQPETASNDSQSAAPGIC